MIAVARPGMDRLEVVPEADDLFRLLRGDLNGQERVARINDLIDAMLAAMSPAPVFGGTTLNGTTHGTTQTEMTSVDLPSGMMNATGRAMEYHFIGRYTWNTSATVNLRSRLDDGTTTVDLATWTAQSFGASGTSIPTILSGVLATSDAGAAGRIYSSHQVLHRARVGEIAASNTYTNHDTTGVMRLEITGQLSAGGALPNTFTPLFLVARRTR